GQDPYHGPNQANGLAFSVSKGIPLPRSLRNIFIELKNDLGIPLSPHGSLETWARQGVFLLNTILTVRAGQPASHANQGWEAFTDQCLSLLWAKKTPLIFVLWGKFAQEKALRILQPSNGHHTILMSSHPSPFSASKGFLGSHPFSKVNEELTKLKSNPIDWRLI
ncbi:MAG: uracil-DNA glycosylase, partial [Minisyncoccia bacterium]